MKDQKHLLKNIHRRKPIHSHSNPQGSTVDSERATFEEEIDNLSRERSALEASLLMYKKQQPIAKLQLEALTQRVDDIEQRQGSLLTFLEKAVQNPEFVELLVRKLESMDFSALNKKRRLPQGDHSQSIPEDSFVENHSTSRPEVGNIIHRDYSSKLSLELSPAVSHINLVSHSTQSSDEDTGSPQRRTSESCPDNTQTRPCGILFAPEPLELSDTGASFTFNMDASYSRETGSCDNPIFHCSQRNLTANEEVEGLISCHLNLTLASSPVQVDKSQNSGRMPQLGQESGKPSEWLSSANQNEADLRTPEKNRPNSDGTITLSSIHDTPPNNQCPPARVNDVFWEQFLTEKPGSSDAEESSSNYKANAYDQQEDRRSGYVLSRNARSSEHLSL